jgi:hypothetical protein
MLVELEMGDHGDTWNDVVGIANRGALDLGHTSGYDLPPKFTVWTAKRVYFPVSAIGDDGCDTIASAPRNPCDEGVSVELGETWLRRRQA